MISSIDCLSILNFALKWKYNKTQYLLFFWCICRSTFISFYFLLENIFFRHWTLRLLRPYIFECDKQNCRSSINFKWLIKNKKQFAKKKRKEKKKNEKCDAKVNEMFEMGISFQVCRSKVYHSIYFVPIFLLWLHCVDGSTTLMVWCLLHAFMVSVKKKMCDVDVDAMENGRYWLMVIYSLVIPLHCVHWQSISIKCSIYSVGVSYTSM